METVLNQIPCSYFSTDRLKKNNSAKLKKWGTFYKKLMSTHALCITNLELLEILDKYVVVSYLHYIS